MPQTFPAILTDGFAIKETRNVTIEEYQQLHMATEDGEFTWCLTFEATTYDHEAKRYNVCHEGVKLGEVEYVHTEYGDRLYRNSKGQEFHLSDDRWAFVKAIAHLYWP